MTYYLLTNCPDCGSQGAAPAESRLEAVLWGALLAQRCPDCGAPGRHVSEPMTDAELPAWAVELVPADWRSYLA